MKRTWLAFAMALPLLLSACASRGAIQDPRVEAARYQAAGLTRVLDLERQPIHEGTELEGQVATSTEPRLRGLLVTVARLQDNLIMASCSPSPTIALQSEPSRDAAAGTYLAQVHSVSVGASPSVSVDLVSPSFVPWATPEDLQRTAWSDYYGWNQVKHVQRLPVSAAATVVGWGEDPLPVVMSLKRFEREYSSRGLSGLVFFVRIKKGPRGTGELEAIWPWWR